VEISLQSSWIRWNDRFRVQRTQEGSYGWNVGFTFVRGAALPGNAPGAPYIFEAHARVGIRGDWLLGSSSEAAALSGMAPARHASSLGIILSSFFPRRASFHLRKLRLVMASVKLRERLVIVEVARTLQKGEMGMIWMKNFMM
jgi:hypothetical protein